MATRSIWTGFGVDVRRSVRPAVTIAGVAVAAFLLIGGAAVGVMYLIVDRAKPEGPTSAAIPLSQLTSGMLQAFECVRVGPKACEQYDQAIAYLSQATPATGFVYTPASDDDPGRASAGGTHTVRLNDDLGRSEWKSVASAVTVEGRATEKTVPPNAVQPTGVDATSFSVPGDAAGAAVSGSMTFTIGNDTVQLKSVTYG